MTHRKIVLAFVLSAVLAGCSPTSNEPKTRGVESMGSSVTTTDRGVAAFRDICFPYKAPFAESYAAAARYGVKKFETTTRSSTFGGKYTYSEGASDDRSLIVGINPEGLCTVRDRRHPGMASDAQIEAQFAALIRTRFPLADKRTSNSYVTVENMKAISFGISLNWEGYNMFSWPMK